MRVLSLSLTPKLPYVLIEKRRGGSRVVETGFFDPAKSALAKKADLVLVEVEGARFLHSGEYQNKTAPDLQAELLSFTSRNVEEGVAVRKAAPTFLSTLRNSQLKAIDARMDELKLRPALVSPEGLGLAFSLNDGFFRAKLGDKTFVYLLENGNLKYFRQVSGDGVTQVRKHFAIENDPVEYQSTNPAFNGVDLQFHSLLSLALHSCFEKEPVNFAGVETVERGLEPLKLRRSVRTCIGLSLLVLMLPIGVGLYGHTVKKTQDEVLLRYTVVKKRSERVLSLKKEALQYFHDLLKISSASGSQAKSQVLSTIARATPSTIGLTSLVQNREGYTLSGYSPEMNDVFQYETQLKGSRVVDSRKAVKDGKEMVIFRMDIK